MTRFALRHQLGYRCSQASIGCVVYGSARYARYARYALYARHAHQRCKKLVHSKEVCVSSVYGGAGSSLVVVCALSTMWLT